MAWVQRALGRRGWRWPAIFVAGALVVAWWWPRSEPEAAPPSAAPPRVEALLDGAAPSAGLSVEPARQPDTLPPARASHAVATPSEGMTAEQARALRDALKDHPQRDAEIARVTEYMAYVSRVERYRKLLTQGRDEQAQARELAESLLAELPKHAQRGEISAGEAVLLQQSLFDTLGSEASVRVQQRLALHDAIPEPADLREQVALDARYKREEAALLIDWNARPAAQRDPVALENALEALRRSVFNSPGSGEPVSSTPGEPR